MGELLNNFFKWAWGLIANIQLLFEWLVTPVNVSTYPLLGTLFEAIGLSDVAPIYLIGGGAVLTGAIVIIVGIIRAIA